MLFSEVARRYASALFDLAKSEGKSEEYLAHLQELSKAISMDAALNDFVTSPLIRVEQKIAAISSALNAAKLPENLKNFCLVLAKKSRLGILSEIVAAYQAKEDEARGVTRGEVVSSSALDDSAKASIQQAIEVATKKKVILNYREDKALIGGLSAKVGGLTFDDSISAHLLRLKEDLTRRAN